jgi:hypothetical protein
MVLSNRSARRSGQLRPPSGPERITDRRWKLKDRPSASDPFVGIVRRHEKRGLQVVEPESLVRAWPVALNLAGTFKSPRRIPLTAVPTREDCLAERNEFELAVPILKRPDDSWLFGSATLARPALKSPPYADECGFDERALADVANTSGIRGGILPQAYKVRRGRECVRPSDDDCSGPSRGPALGPSRSKSPNSVESPS